MLRYKLSNFVSNSILFDENIFTFCYSRPYDFRVLYFVYGYTSSIYMYVYLYSMYINKIAPRIRPIRHYILLF